jgi:TolB-like protein
VVPFSVILLLIGLVVVFATALAQSGLKQRREGAWDIDLGGLKDSVMASRIPTLTWGRAILGGVMAFSVLFGFAGLYVLISERGSVMPVKEAVASASPGFAVLPFRVTGQDMDLWREGMVDLLSTNLEGVAELRKTDPTAILSEWRQDIGEGRDASDSEQAYGVARDLGAAYALTGSIVGSPTEVRLSVEVYDLRQNRVTGTASVDGSPEDILGLVDQLSLEIVKAGLVPLDAELPQFDISSVTTTSLEALKAYLEGEQKYRRSRWLEAASRFKEATEADSTFALAWYRLSTSYSWEGGTAFDLIDEAAEKAIALSDRLPERDRLLLKGFGEFSSGDIEGLETLEGLLKRYPDDVEGWALLGDAYVHLGGARLVPADDYREAFEQAIDLDPYFGPAYIHLIEDSFSRIDSAYAHRMLDDFAAIDSETKVCGDFQWDYAMLWGDSASRAQAVDELGELGTQKPACSLWGMPPLPEFIADLQVAYDDLSNRGVDQSAGLMSMMTAKGGRIEASRAYMGEFQFEDTPWLPSTLAALHLVTYEDPAPDAWLAFMREHPTPGHHFWLGAVAAANGDANGVDAQLAAIEGLAAGFETAGFEADGESGDAAEDAAHARAFADALEVYASLRVDGADAADDAPKVIKRLPVFGPGSSVSPFLRYEMGRWLAEREEYAEARRYLESFSHFNGYYPILADFYLGQVYEALGLSDRAADSNGRFGLFWQDADPPLASKRDEALARSMERLPG